MVRGNYLGTELVKNPLFARYFARCGARNEERGGRELRRELLAGLSGRAMEVGAGTGLNFPHYPVSVREVVAVEPEPYLRGRAVEAAAAAGVPIRVVAGTAAELPAADGEFDAVVISGLLCSVSDAPAALAEFARVLRPRGHLVIADSRMDYRLVNPLPDGGYGYMRHYPRARRSMGCGR